MKTVSILILVLLAGCGGGGTSVAIPSAPKKPTKPLPILTAVTLTVQASIDEPGDVQSNGVTPFVGTITIPSTLSVIANNQYGQATLALPTCQAYYQFVSNQYVHFGNTVGCDVGSSVAITGDITLALSTGYLTQHTSIQATIQGLQ